MPNVPEAHGPPGVTASLEYRHTNQPPSLREHYGIFDARARRIGRRVRIVLTIALRSLSFLRQHSPDAREGKSPRAIMCFGGSVR